MPYIFVCTANDDLRVRLHACQGNQDNNDKHQWMHNLSEMGPQSVPTMCNMWEVCRYLDVRDMKDSWAVGRYGGILPSCTT